MKNCLSFNGIFIPLIPNSFKLLLLIQIQQIHCQFDNGANFTGLFLAPAPVNGKLCANSGRFLGTYCLADYNCDQGRPGSKQVCIRGRCCTKTRTSKASANQRTAEDRVCPSRTFSVGLSCSQTRECLRKAKLPVNSPLPLLECAARAKTCCTSSQYKKPLVNGQWCLNGGKALGQINGFRQCVTHKDCRNGQRPRAVCVDRQCCTPPIRQGDKKINNWEEDEADEWDMLKDNDGQLDSDLDDSMEEIDGDFNDYNNDVDLIDDDSGILPKAGRQLKQGRRICRRYGLPYLQIRRCSPRLSCGDRRRFRCISTHCCLNYNAGNKYDEDEYDQEEEEAEEDNLLPDRISEGGGRIPAGTSGYCKAAGRFRRFLGQFCRQPSDCPRALDRRRRIVPIRCIRGACCAAMVRRKGVNDDVPKVDDEDNSAGGGLLPLRPAGAFAFCFDGTLSRQQCFSPLDCRFPKRQICANGLCCPPSVDQIKYACGSLASAGQCTASSGILASSASCRDNLFCVSPGACCECRHGQPQKDVADCRNRRGICHSGFACNPRSGFCCPRCAGGGMPFGSCYLGKCARGFACRRGNICCQKREQMGKEDNWEWGRLYGPELE